MSVSQHVLHLQPRSFDRQQTLSFNLDIAPTPTTQSVGNDYFENIIHYLSIQEPHSNLVVEASSSIEVFPQPTQPAHESSAPWEHIAQQLAAGSPEIIQAQQFCFDSPYSHADADVQQFALESFLPGKPILEAAMTLTARIFDDFEYQGGVSDVSTPVKTVLEMRKGVCQDFAHLQIACLRSLGLAARYVSGYLLTHPPEGKEKLVGSDASHAWLSVWAGDLGWVDFDPTNRVVPQDEHITVAWGRDYGDVSPISGFIVGGGSHKIKVEVDVNTSD